MSEELKHIKVVSKQVLPDGVVQISTESYYEELAHEQTDYEKPYIVDRADILTKYISCLDHVILDGSAEVTVSIKRKPGGKWLLVKHWVGTKRTLGRR